MTHTASDHITARLSSDHIPTDKLSRSELYGTVWILLFYFCKYFYIAQISLHTIHCIDITINIFTICLYFYPLADTSSGIIKRQSYWCLQVCWPVVVLCNGWILLENAFEHTLTIS